MLHGLSINNRKPEELRALARDRRELAISKTGRLKALLLNEAKLLEFHADLRIWMVSTARPLSESALPSRPETGLIPLRHSTLGRLMSRMALSAEDEQALVSAARARIFERDDVVLAEGGRCDALHMLCGGAARASRTLEGGNLQIVSVFLPGDALNPGDVLLGRSPTTISALTSSLVLSIPADELRLLLAHRPSIVRALWRETALLASIQRERLIGLGRKAAEARLAHVLCEFAYRLQKDARDGDAVELPLTQVELADLLGLSPVHVNRVLQHLRGRRLVEFSRGRLVIWKKNDLYAFAEFDPQYLQTEPADDS